MVGYEISQHIGQYSGYTVRLMMVLMSTLAKLASRCQDLIPRALLSLSKIVNQSIVSQSPPPHSLISLAYFSKIFQSFLIVN